MLHRHFLAGEMEVVWRLFVLFLKNKAKFVSTIYHFGIFMISLTVEFIMVLSVQNFCM